jgi:hypothetical protein
MCGIRLKNMILSLGFMLGGCGQNIYYYQNDGLMLKMQGRPSDASQPVQGTLAFKERVALVVPQKQDGEAYSLLSGFSFDKESKGSDGKPAIFGPLHIRSALITGEAATQVASANDAPKVALQLAQLHGEDTLPAKNQATGIVEKLSDVEKSQMQEFKDCPSKLNKQQENKFAKLTKNATYNPALCKEIIKLLNQ